MHETFKVFGNFLLNYFIMQKIAPLFFLIASYTTCAQHLSIHVPVSAGNQASAPVRVQLPKPLANASYQLYNEKTRKTIPSQLLDSTTLVFMMEESLATGEYIYSLKAGKKNK